MVAKSLQLLKELRKQGKTRAAVYESDEDSDLETTSPLKHHIDDEDFVEDDDGEGYVDDGLDQVAEAPKPKRAKTGTIIDAFKRAPKPVASTSTPHKSDVSCDDLFAQLGSTKKTPAKGMLGRLQATPITPTPVRQPLMSRPVMRSFHGIKPLEPEQAKESSEQPTEEPIEEPIKESREKSPGAPIESREKPSANIPIDDFDSDIDLSGVMEPVLASDPPLPDALPKQQYQQEQIEHAGSYPTPNQSSEPDFEFSYDQNVVDFSSESGAQEISTDNLDFFFTDFHELGNKLMLFGRTQSTTACMIVEQLYRNVFFLPAEGQSAKDIKKDITLAIVEGLGRDARVLSRVTNKKYCFGDKSIPTEAEYVQVQVPYTLSAEWLKAKFCSNNKLVKNMFGAETTLYESFMLERKVKGPSWLTAKSIRQLPSSTTSCSVSASVNFNNLSPCEQTDLPTFTIMSLSLRTWLNPETKVQEIVAITARFFKNVPHDTRTSASQLPSTVVTGVRPILGVFPMRFSSLLKEDQERSKFKSVYEHRNEVAMLKWFLPFLKKHDPDMIVGHNLENIHLGILFERLKALKVSTWHFLGRMGTAARMPQRVDKGSLKYWLPGRLCCDLNNDMGKSATPKCTTWSLTEMAKLYINETRPEVDFDVSKSLWDVKDAKGLIMILRQNERDTLTTASLTIAIQIIPLSKVLTNLAGNSWFKTLSGSRVDRNNNLLLHEFTAANYIVPEKKVNQSDGSRKAKFTGGLVLEPEKGLCRNMVLVMDFNSLYPSIIREFNICFSTVDLRPTKDDDLPDLPAANVQQGVFPRIIQNLVERRQTAKREMKNPNVSEAEKQQLDIRQQALKLTANSMYGCLGFEASRFYAMPLAELVTSKGREILQATRTLAEQTNDLRVLYGDTDSLMINTRTTDYDRAISLGNDFKQQVNSRYRKLEIDIDYVFSALLLNAKKKYAATKMSRNPTTNQLESELEVKGIDLRRREFCDLSKEMSKHALHLILESADLDEAINEFYIYLKTMAAKIRGGEIPLSKYIIRTKLGKDPQKYSESEAKKSAHVVMALRRLAAGEIIKADDFMQFIIVAGEEPQAERARTIVETRDQDLAPDYEYYLVNQIANPIKRICANIEGFDDNAISDSLGIEKTPISHYSGGNSNKAVNAGPEEYAKFETTMLAAERFKDCKPLGFKCNCGHEFYYRGFSELSGRGIECPECNTSLSNLKLSVQLERRMTDDIEKYYAGWTVCSECKHETKQLSVLGRNCLSQNGRCPGRVQPVYTSRELYAQLSYYLSLFDDLDIDQKYKAVAVQNEDRLAMLKGLVSRYLGNNARRVVDMRSLFASF